MGNAKKSTELKIIHVVKIFFLQGRNTVVFSEPELIKKINFLKGLIGDCKKIEAQLKGICSLINSEWDRESAPSVSSIQNTIEIQLIHYRSKLSEVRGE